MPKKTEKNLLVGLDIGTSKVVAIVGEVMPDGAIDPTGDRPQRMRALLVEWRAAVGLPALE